MLVNLSRSVITRMPLRDSAQPFLKKLVEVSGECSHLAIYAHESLYMSINGISFYVAVNVRWVGQLAPLQLHGAWEGDAGFWQVSAAYRA
jgi:DNA-binding IclR family transcriptional regulator